MINYWSVAKFTRKKYCLHNIANNIPIRIFYNNWHQNFRRIWLWLLTMVIKALWQLNLKPGCIFYQEIQCCTYQCWIQFDTFSGGKCRKSLWSEHSFINLEVLALFDCLISVARYLYYLSVENSKHNNCL